MRLLCVLVLASLLSGCTHVGFGLGLNKSTAEGEHGMKFEQGTAFEVAYNGYGNFYGNPKHSFRTGIAYVRRAMDFSYTANSGTTLITSFEVPFIYRYHFDLNQTQMFMGGGVALNTDTGYHCKVNNQDCAFSDTASYFAMGEFEAGVTVEKSLEVGAFFQRGFQKVFYGASDMITTGLRIRYFYGDEPSKSPTEP